MDTKLLNEMLVAECESNPASHAVCSLFAIRERARGTVNLISLHNAMKAEGYKYEKKEYVAILALLVKAGAGVGVYNKRNELTGVKNITIKLQSIGAMAIKASSSIAHFRRRPVYRNLPPTLKEVKVPKNGDKVESNVIKNDNIVLELNIPESSVPVRLTLGRGIAAKDLTHLIEKLIS